MKLPNSAGKAKNRCGNGKEEPVFDTVTMAKSYLNLIICLSNNNDSQQKQSLFYTVLYLYNI